jgi:hypothetical protein
MLKRILQPAVIAAFTEFLIAFRSWKPVFDSISEQKDISASYLLRHLAVFIVQGSVVFAFVYWRVSSLLRNKGSALSKVVNANSKQSQPAP